MPRNALVLDASFSAPIAESSTLLPRTERLTSRVQPNPVNSQCRYEHPQKRVSVELRYAVARNVVVERLHWCLPKGLTAQGLDGLERQRMWKIGARWLVRLVEGFETPQLSRLSSTLCLLVGRSRFTHQRSILLRNSHMVGGEETGEDTVNLGK